MTIDIDDCIALAERELSPKRFEHSVGVMQVMGELASVYDFDESTAKLCGILHDVAKEFSPERQLALAAKYNISLNREHDEHPLFLHGPIGACYITETLGITNPVILDAIVHHSYFGNGTAISPALCWCLRFSDILEPSRDWKDIRMQLKPLVYSGNLIDSAHFLMNWSIPFHESRSLPVHPNMQRVFQELSTLRNVKRLNAVDLIPV